MNVILLFELCCCSSYTYNHPFVKLPSYHSNYKLQLYNELTTKCTERHTEKSLYCIDKGRLNTKYKMPCKDYKLS